MWITSAPQPPQEHEGSNGRTPVSTEAFVSSALPRATTLVATRSQPDVTGSACGPEVETHSGLPAQKTPSPGTRAAPLSEPQERLEAAARVPVVPPTLAMPSLAGAGGGSTLPPSPGSPARPCRRGWRKSGRRRRRSWRRSSRGSAWRRRTQMAGPWQRRCPVLLAPSRASSGLDAFCQGLQFVEEEEEEEEEAEKVALGAAQLLFMTSHDSLFSPPVSRCCLSGFLFTWFPVDAFPATVFGGFWFTHSPPDRGLWILRPILGHFA